MRLVCLVLLLFGLGCKPIESLESSDTSSTAKSGESVSPQDWKDTQQVQQDVRQILAATFDGDVDTLLRLSHDKVIGMVDNPKKAREIMKDLLGKIAAMNMKLDEFDFTGEPQFVETEQSHFVIVPMRMVLSIEGKKAESVGYQFGQKSKSDSKWKYIEGKQVNKQTVGRFFPDFPSDFEFPDVSRKIN